MKTLASYACGRWQTGSGDGRELRHAVTGEVIARASAEGIDRAAMLDHGRTVGGPALRSLTFHQRAALLKGVTRALGEHLDELYEIAYTYGATKKDAWIDIEGGIGAAAVLASMAKKQLPETTFLADGEATGLSREGSFAGRHLWVPLEGVAVQINAFNFPSWGMLEKLAPALLAGMPTLVKPATPTALLAQRMVEIVIEAGVLPDGALQLLVGEAGDLLDHLTCQDVVSFTGSAETGRRIKGHPRVIAEAVRVNLEADSLNAAILGPDVEPGSPVFAAFVKEVVREMTVKAGQKCTAIRRILVPEERRHEVIDAIAGRLATTTVGDPRREGVRMGPLVSREQVEAARRGIAELGEECEVAWGEPDGGRFEADDAAAGAYFGPVLLSCRDPESAERVHRVEVFGPVATVIAYRDLDQAIELGRRGGGSLVASLYSEDEETAERLTFGLAPYHGRLLVMNERAAGESTGHGIVMPQLVHGGPGRAGGGEELGGLRSLHHHMQRLAVQGAPERLERLAAGA